MHQWCRALSAIFIWQWCKQNTVKCKNEKVEKYEVQFSWCTQVKGYKEQSDRTLCSWMNTFTKKIPWNLFVYLFVYINKIAKVL